MESLISGAKARVTEILSESVGILTLHNENCGRVLFHIRDLYVNGKKCYPGKLLSNCISVGTFVNCDAVKVELHIPYLATFVCVGWSPDFGTVFSEFVVEKHKMPVPMFGYAYRGIVVKLLFPSTALAMVSIDKVLVPTLISVDYEIENLKVGKSKVPIMNCYACEDIVLVKFHHFPYSINGIHPFLVAQNVCKEKPVSTIIKPVVIFPPKPGSAMTQPVCLGHPFKEKLVPMKAKLVGNVTVTRSPSNVVLTEMTLHESPECIDINVLPIKCEKRNSLALLIYENIYVHVPMHFNSWDVPSGRTDLESSYLPLQKRMMKQFKESTCFNSIIRIYTFFHDKEPSRRSWSLVPAALPSGEIDLVYVPELLLVGLESPVNPHRCLLKINHFKREVISCSGHFVPGIVVYERPGRVIPFEFTQNMVFVNGKRLSPECSLEHLFQSKRIEVNIEATRKILKLTSVHIEIFHGYVKLSRGFAMILNKNQNKRKHSEETSVSSVKGQNEKDGECNITKKPVESRLSKEPITDTRQVRDSHDNSNNKDDVLCARSSRDHSSLKHNISSERETENLPKKVENISGTLIEMLPGGIAHMMGRISRRKIVNIVLKWENVEGCTSVKVFKELVQKRTALYADIERVKSEVILYHATIAWRTMQKPAGKLFHEILTQSNIAEITAKLLSPLKTVDQLQQNAGTVDKCTGNTVQYSKNCEETQSNDIVDSNKEKKKLSVPFTDSSRDHISSLPSFRSILENTKRSNLPAMAENITGVLVEMVPDGIVYVVGKISKKKFVNVVVRWENLTGCKTVNELKKLVQNRTCLYADIKLIKPELILYHATLAWLEKKPVRKFSQRELTDADITEMTTRILAALRTNENLEISATQGKTSFNATNNRTKRKKSKDEPRSNEITDKTAQSNSDITKNPVGDKQIIINIEKDINRPSSVDNNIHKQTLNEVKMGSFKNLASVMHNIFSEETDSKENDKIKILTEIVDNDAGKYTAANDLVKEDKSERKKSKDEPRANEITDKIAQSNSDITKTPVGDERIIIVDKEVIRSSSVDNNTHKQNLNEIKMGSFENLASVMHNIFSEETDSKEEEKIKILTEIVDNDAGDCTAANDLVKEDKQEQFNNLFQTSNAIKWISPFREKNNCIDYNKYKKELDEVNTSSFKNQMHNVSSEESDNSKIEGIRNSDDIVDKLTGTMSYSINKMTRVEGKEQIIENKREVSSIDNDKYKVVFTEYNIELDREISEVRVPSNNHTDNEEFANNNETQELNWIVDTGSDSKSNTTENFLGEEENGETRSLDGIIDNDTDNKSNVTEKSVIEEDSKEGDTEVSNPVDNKKGPNNLNSESYRDLVMSMHNTNCVYSGTGSEKYEDLHTTVDIFDKHTGRVVSNTVKVPVAGEKSEEQILKDSREVNNSKGECKMNEVNTGIENLVSTVHNLSSEERQGETVKDEEQNKDKKEVNELYKESSKGQFLSFNVCEKSYELCSGSSSQPPKANRFQISIDDNMTEAKSATSATENMQLKRKKKTKWSKVEDFFSSETSLKSYKTYEAEVTHFENPKALVATITLADQEFEVFVLNRFFTPARFTRTLCDSEPMASFVALGDRLYVKPKPRLPCNDHYKYEWFAMHAWTEDEDTDLEKSVSEENKQLEDEEEDGVEGILIAIFEQYGVIEDSGCKEKLVFYRENALLFQAPLATVDLNCIFKIGDTIRFSMKNNTVQVWMGKSENITESTIQIFQFCKTNSVDDKTKIALMQALAPQNPQPPQHLENASRLSATSKSRCDSSDVDTVFFETASDGGDLHSDDESLYSSMSSTDVENDEAGCSHFLRHNRSFQSLSSVTESQLPDSNLYTERGISIDEPRDQDTIQNCSLHSDYVSVKNVLVKSTEIDQDPVNATLALESRNANTQCSVLNADDISAQNGLIQNSAVGQGLASSLRRVLAPNQINEELLLETLEREMYHMLRRVSSRLMGSTDHVAGWMDTLRNCTTARSSQTISTGNVFTLKHYIGDL